MHIHMHIYIHIHIHTFTFTRRCIRIFICIRIRKHIMEVCYHINLTLTHARMGNTCQIVHNDDNDDDDDDDDGEY